MIYLAVLYPLLHKHLLQMITRWRIKVQQRVL